MTGATASIRRGAPLPAVLRGIDPWIAIPAGILLCLGLVMVASASMGLAERQVGYPFYYLQRQALYVILGVAVAFTAIGLPLRVWERLGGPLILASLVLLALVLVPGLGKEVNGSLRWLPLGPFHIQVAEPAKLFVIIYLAGYLVRHAGDVQDTAMGFIRPALVLTFICILLLLQPDFGTAVVLMAAALGTLFLGGVRLSQFALLGVVSVVGFMALAVVSPYRYTRLTAFTDPWAFPYDSGFQLTQALIAIGRGEWFGVGLGGSVQKLFYLPEAHTDFLFAVVAEELGLLGSIAVVALYWLIVWRAFAIGGAAHRAGQPFAGYLAYGLGLWLGLQAFVNIGVNMGVLPTKGLTLPLMSYGGSSMLVTCAAVGLLLRVAREAGTTFSGERRHD